MNISKYGRDFSLVRVPYAFKLLMQELQGMNIQMRIITEDNIDQLLSLANGHINEIQNLTHDPNSNLNQIKKLIVEKQRKNNTEIENKERDIYIREYMMEDESIIKTQAGYGSEYMQNPMMNMQNMQPMNMQMMQGNEFL